LEHGQYAAAEPVLRECLALREKGQPDEWATFNTRSMLGGTLLGQGKYADAEPLLLQGYEGLHARADKMPPAARVRLPEAGERPPQFSAAGGRRAGAAAGGRRLPEPVPPPRTAPVPVENPPPPK